MPRLREQRYKRVDGSNPVNCYNLSITRKIAEEAGFTPEDYLTVRAEKGKITVEKEASGEDQAR